MDRNRQENDACESNNLLESEDSDEDVRDKGLPIIASLFEEAEEDEEQVMQTADAKKFEEEQKSDESLKAFLEAGRKQAI